MYRQCSCLYQYSAYIFIIGTYSDPYTSIGATLIVRTDTYCVVLCWFGLDNVVILMVSKDVLTKK